MGEDLNRRIDRLSDDKRAMLDSHVAPRSGAGNPQRPGADDDAPASPFVGPRTAEEKEMASIWADLLGLERVGVHDDFFSLGGHSLLAAQIVARVNPAFDVVLPLHALFSAPTVAAFTRTVVTAREAQDADLEAVLAELEQLSEEDARAIVAQREAPPTPVRPPARSAVAPTERPELGELSAAFTALRLIRRGRGEVALFLVHEIDGQVIGYRHLLDQLSGAPTVYGLESPGLDRAAPMLPTIDRMAARYVEEILSVDPTGPRIVVGSCFGGVVAYEVARQLHAAGSPGTVVAMLDSVPYGLTSGSKDDVGGTKRDRAGRKSALQSLAATRRMLYRRVWWSRARRYLEAGRVLPPDLHLPIIMHQVAIRFYTTRPYAGRVLNFIPAAIPGDQRQRRELWRDLVDDFELVPIDGALVTHRSFLRGPWIAQVAARLRTEMDRLVTRR